MFHLLTLKTEETLTKVMALMWRCHRAGSYHFPLKTFAKELACTEGALEQMLDRKYKLVFGAGGPLRGAYNTKGKKKAPVRQGKLLSWFSATLLIAAVAEIQYEPYQPGEGEFGDDDYQEICGYRPSKDLGFNGKENKKKGVLNMAATAMVDDDDSGDYVEETSRSVPSPSPQINIKDEVPDGISTTGSSQYPTSPLDNTGSSMFTELPYHGNHQSSMAFNATVSPIFDGFSMPNTPVMQHQAFQQGPSYHSYAPDTWAQQTFHGNGLHTYGQPFFSTQNNGYGQVTPPSSQQSSQHSDLLGVGSQFDGLQHSFSSHQLDPLLGGLAPASAMPEKVKLPNAESLNVNDKGLGKQPTVQIPRSAAKKQKVTPYTRTRRASVAKQPKSSPYVTPKAFAATKVPSQYLSKFKSSPAASVNGHKAATENVSSPSPTRTSAPGFVNPAQLMQGNEATCGPRKAAAEASSFPKLPPYPYTYPFDKPSMAIDPDLANATGAAAEEDVCMRTPSLMFGENASMNFDGTSGDEDAAAAADRYFKLDLEKIVQANVNMDNINMFNPSQYSSQTE